MMSTQLVDSIELAIMDLSIQRKAVELLKLQQNEVHEEYERLQVEFQKGEVTFLDVEEARIAVEQAAKDYIEGWNQVWSFWYTVAALAAG